MVGNVWEWIEHTDTPDGSATTNATFVGGGFEHSTTTNCGATSGTSIVSIAADVGFRCCSP
jgi:hypothetical protein